MTPHSSLNRRQMLSRLGRDVLAASLATIPIRAVTADFVQWPDDRVPATGRSRPEYKSFDQLMTTFLKEHDVPGAAVAVSRNGQLTFSRGYGYADVEAKEKVQPDSLFRIASVSKPITSVAVLKLVEAGKLSLDEPAFPRMNLQPAVDAASIVDPRWNQITIRQCLHHTGGWDRDISGDPIVKVALIAQTLQRDLPVGPEQVVRFMLTQPLDFAPGERHAYSNLGYLVLGRIIEAVSGQSYESYVQQQILAPLGIKSAALGKALPEHKAANEVKYYDRANRTGSCVYPPRAGETVPIQYGVSNLEAYEAHGGWIASAADLIRFARAFDDPKDCRILKAPTIAQMWSRPTGAAGTGSDGQPLPVYYALGWNVRPVPQTESMNTWHAGYIPGSESLLIRRADGFNFAVVFNTNDSKNGKSLAGLIDPLLHEAADAVKAR